MNSDCHFIEIILFSMKKEERFLQRDFSRGQCRLREIILKQNLLTEQSLIDRI